MADRLLHVAPELDLPINAATETFGILAKKGAGKSNAAVDPLPTGPDLGRYWLDKLPPSEAKVLAVLLDAWPTPLTKTDLAAAADYTATGGRFANILSRLRTLGLIEGTTDLRAADDLCEG